MIQQIDKDLWRDNMRNDEDSIKVVIVCVAAIILLIILGIILNIIKVY